MPTRRFSHISVMPTPFRAPISLSFVKSSTAPSFSPLTATGMPFSKSTVTYSGLSGASSGAFEIRNISFFGSFHGSSRSEPSCDRCQMLRSMLYVLFSSATGMPCFFAYSISSVRAPSSHSRHGAMIVRFGASALIVSSKRTWSLPLPVAPCAMASAPSAFAISTRRLAISGRANDVPKRYLPS